MFCPTRVSRFRFEEKNMPKRRSFLSRLARALPVVLAAAPGVIDAIRQAREALRGPQQPDEKPAAPAA
jgi:hypothetical protein